MWWVANRSQEKMEEKMLHNQIKLEVYILEPQYRNSHSISVL